MSRCSSGFIFLRLAGVAGLVLLIFSIDLVTPLGLASWMLYVIPIWYASRVDASGRWAAGTAFCCSLLIGAGFFGPPGYPLWIGVANRTFGIALLWAAAVLLVRAGQRKDIVRRQAALLEEHATLLDEGHVMVRHLDGRILTWSKGLERLYGWSRDEAVGRLSHDLLQTAASQPLPDIQRQAATTGHWSGELRRRRRDGSELIVVSDWVLHHDTHGQPVIIETNNDITALKRTQDALHENRSRLELALTAASLGTWDLDLVTGEMLESHERSSMFGLPPGVMNRTLAEWRTRIHPDDMQRTMEGFNRSVAAGDPIETEYRIVWSDGSIHWIASKGAVLVDEAGKPRRAIGVSYDVTPRKEAEQQIRRLLAEAEAREVELRVKQDQLVQTAKLASLGELATGIAHELNNPLNNIGLFVGNAMDRLRHTKPDLSIVRLDLDRSLAQVQKAANIISHLRTFGRMAPRQREPIAVNEVMTAAVSLVQEQLRLRQVRLCQEFAPENPLVQGNRIQLEQVFVNLITNARDAVEDAPVREIGITTAVRGGWVDVEVRDTGHGIPVDSQSRVFDPFFTTKEVGQGTGLGLSITYGIVKEHQGNISVESVPEEGSTFRVSLPLAGA